MLSTCGHAYPGFGLNFELWVQKLAELEPLAQIEVSREGLGLGLAGALEWVVLLTLWSLPATLDSQFRTFSPPSLLVRAMTPPVGVWPSPYLLQGRGTWPRCADQAAVPLPGCSFPCLTKRESWTVSLRDTGISRILWPCGQGL